MLVIDIHVNIRLNSPVERQRLSHGIKKQSSVEWSV